MNKIGNLLPCRSAPQQPIQPRSTSNSLCHVNTEVNNFMSNKTLQIGNILIPIPCFLIPHESEFRSVIEQVGYIKAVKLLAAKYNVNIAPPKKNVRRYKYPVVNMQPYPPVIQFSISYRLEEPAIIPPLGPFPNFSVISNDARYISLCNDDTKTFSKTITDMKQYATFWWSKLPNFTDPLYYCTINTTNQLLTAHTGCLFILANRLVYVPVIRNALFIMYSKYSELTPIKFLYIGSSQDTAHDIISQLYLTSTDSCSIVNRHIRVAKLLGSY
jgi:hypothetical protein